MLERDVNNMTAYYGQYAPELQDIQVLKTVIEGKY